MAVDVSVSSRMCQATTLCLTSDDEQPREGDSTVGVIEGTDADPCAQEPRYDHCQDLKDRGLKFYVNDRLWKAETGCPVMVLGKVYNLTEFKQRHWGGTGSISCRKDITSNCECQYSFQSNRKIVCE